MGVAPQTCLQVKENLEDEYSLFYSTIEGFEFEPGFEYELLVNKQIVPNPPADASSFRWTLVEVVSKTPVAPAAELEGVTWQLIAYTDQNGMLSMFGVESTITLQDGEAGGLAGCNMFFAPYTLDGDQLTFGPAGSTMMACEERAMAQEQTFLANLEKSRLTRSSPTNCTWLTPMAQCCWPSRCRNRPPSPARSGRQLASTTARRP
jgi:heat shock protein HslJ